MEMNERIVIDSEKCIGCGSCAADCPAGIISLQDGKAVRKNQLCIVCGHCFAVCPAEAVSISGYDCSVSEPSVPMTGLDPERLLAAMKSRRSVRRFEKRTVEDELINKIVEAVRYCPTGKNRQDVFVTVIKDSIDEFEKEAVEVFRRSRTEQLYCSKDTRFMTISDGLFFHGAPLALLLSSRDAVDASLAEAYAELLAESMGLGCFHCGYFVDAVKSSEKLRGMAEIPERAEPVTCLVLGWPVPELRYLRIPPRNAAKLVRK